MHTPGLAQATPLTDSHLCIPLNQACIDWQTTVSTLDKLRAGVQARRTLLGPKRTLNRGIDSRRERERSQSAKRDFNELPPRN